MLNEFHTKLTNALNNLVAGLCIVLILALFVQVVNRYLFGVSWPAITYIVSFCFVWMCIIGIALTVSPNSHFVVDVLVRRLLRDRFPIFRVFIAFNLFLSGLIILWSSLPFIDLGIIKRDPTVGWPMIYIYMSLPFCGALLIYYSLVTIISYKRNNK